MKIKSRAIVIVLGLLITLLGLACLNYTSAGNHVHHIEWSQQHGLPAPNRELFFGGAGLSVLGGILLGWAFRR